MTIASPVEGRETKRPKSATNKPFGETNMPICDTETEVFDTQPLDAFCTRCGSSMGHVRCWNCDEDGFSGHDCGEDCCCCLHPEPNVTCDVCHGRTGWVICMSEKCRTREALMANAQGAD